MFRVSRQLVIENQPARLSRGERDELAEKDIYWRQQKVNRKVKREKQTAACSGRFSCWKRVAAEVAEVWLDFDGHTLKRQATDFAGWRADVELTLQKVEAIDHNCARKVGGAANDIRLERAGWRLRCFSFYRCYL